SMLGLSAPGRSVWLSEHPRCSKRRLLFTWEAVRAGRSWVCVNTQQANRVAAMALAARAIPDLGRYEEIQAEVRAGERSRMDFLLKDPRHPSCYVEVKSVTLRLGDQACFPDAVTSRGQRHLAELSALVRQGHRAALLFLVMRGDCRSMRPADEIDAEFGRALRQAARAGVLILAYAVQVSRRGLALGARLPVKL
ncbi:MAG: DNA/RNA nuclease SfsA, partial [Vicinamibacteria bacterium]|nr:DNA/RNA nuclease SfsA [Vicinamibacteria bacterium]